MLEASAWSMHYVFDENSDDEIVPSDVVTWDVDGDGLVDVVVSSEKDRTVVVFFNEGVDSQSNEVSFTALVASTGSSSDAFTEFWSPERLLVGVLDPAVSTLPSVVAAMDDATAVALWPLPQRPGLEDTGCVRVRNGTLVARRVRFEGCAYGGIVATNSALVVEASQFTECHALSGGAISSDGGSLRVNSTEFVKCSASSGSGGGVFLASGATASILSAIKKAVFVSSCI